MRRKNTEQNVTLPPELCRIVTVARAYPNPTQSQICFLFAWHMEEIPEPARIELLFNPEVEECLGTKLFGALVPSHATRWGYHYARSLVRPEHVAHHPRAFMVTAVPEFLPTGQEPDAEVIYIRHEHIVNRVSIADLVDQCFHLHKLMGCESCPRQGYNCLVDHQNKRSGTWRKECKQQLFPFMDEFTLPLLEHFRYPYFGFGDWQDLKLTSWKSQFAGYTVVPPLATSGTPLTPGTESLRVPYEHNFFKLEDTKDELSSRAEAGVETRRVRREECSKCFLGGKYGHTVHPCMKYAPRHCKHGAWTEEELVKTTLDYVKPQIEPHFTLDELWCIANTIGVPFPKKSEHTGRDREWMLCRMELSGSHDFPLVVACRTAKGSRHESQSFSFAKDVYQFLSKGTKLVWDNAREKPRDDALLALWLHVAFLTHEKSYSYFWHREKTGDCGYGNCAPRVGSVGLSSSGVQLRLWLSKETRTVYFGNFKDMVDRYEDLPLFNICHLRADILANRSLYARVR